MQVKIGIISLLIKFKYKIYYSPKIANTIENTFSFIPHVCYFPCHPSIAASKSPSLTTLFSTKMRGRKYSHKNIDIPDPFYLTAITAPLLSAKNLEKTLGWACETLTLIEGFVFSSCRYSKQSVSHLLTVSWSEHFICWFAFVVETKIHYFMLLTSLIW